jgi:hypothetical protein
VITMGCGDACPIYPGSRQRLRLGGPAAVALRYERDGVW